MEEQAVSLLAPVKIVHGTRAFSALIDSLRRFQNLPSNTRKVSIRKLIPLSYDGEDEQQQRLCRSHDDRGLDFSLFLHGCGNQVSRRVFIRRSGAVVQVYHSGQHHGTTGGEAARCFWLQDIPSPVPAIAWCIVGVH